MHKLEDNVNLLFDKATQSPSTFSQEDANSLNSIVAQLTDIMLSRERQCSGWRIQ
jgi:ribonuclease D